MEIITDQIWAKKNIEKIKDVLHNSKSIAISGHINPDGDSIGSLLALGLGLESIGKKVYMLCCDQIPQKYTNLPGAFRLVSTINTNVDLAIAVDCGNKEMIGPVFEVFKRADAILEIDHHHSRNPFGNLSLIDSEATSAGELVYKLLLELGIRINSSIAQNILTSIIVETNSFRLPGIRSSSFEICADLLRTGVDFYKLAEAVYWVNSRETALLSGICLSRCRFSYQGQLAWSILTKKDFEKVGASETDADPATEKIRSIQGVKIAILFREKTKYQLRVSLRSKCGINVSTIAEKFGGGGHISAAGCTIPNTKQAIKSILYHTRNLLIKSTFEIDEPETCDLSINPLNNVNQMIGEVPSVVFFNTIVSKRIREAPVWQKETETVSTSLR